MSLRSLQAKVAQYDTEDVFNADECGLFYRMNPTQAIVLERIPGVKKQRTESLCTHVPTWTDLKSLSSFS